MKTYLVGGAVRDQLLGLTPTEKDWVVTGSSQPEMLERGFVQVGKDFPVFLHPETKEEYALARTEKNIGPGYHGFSFNTNVTLEEDLLRRDLTINAIAQDENGQIIDPFGGQQDIVNKTLRAVSPAFSEDPVRVLRIARFGAKFPDFTVDKNTNELMRKMAQLGDLAHLVPERVWQETKKALAAQKPVRFIQILKNCGALAVIFPEISNLFGVPQPAKHHPEIDVGVHTLLVLEQATILSPKTTVRFAALVHDLGKGITKLTILPHHYGHEDTGAKLVKKLCQRLKVPNEYRDLAYNVAKYHGKFHRVLDEMKATSIVKLLMDIDAFRRPERLEDFILCGIADQRGRTGFENHISLSAEFLREVFATLKTIDISEIANHNQSGENIKQQIYQQRVAVVKELKRNRSV